MLYTIISILSVLVVALSFAIYNILQKLEKYEDIIEENDMFLQTELEKNEALLEALRQIDNRQMFEKDDDVGSIFYQIKETIEKFKQRSS
jgi:predicted Holliday junction resolvase-like endonuclease